MKKIALYAIAVAFVGLLAGCLDDDNNYNYKPVNDIQGGSYNFENFAYEYSIFSGQELKLEPTFKFTIDSIRPDVSYEWYVNHQLLPEETGPTYTFKSDKSGTYEVTFAVQDNKSGVKFAKSTSVKVRSVGLMDNLGDMDYYNEYGIEVYDEPVVKQDIWAELNGNTLEREVYTYQEFGDDSQVPAGFSPVEAAMTYSAKAVRDKNGLIYWENKGDVTDFHAGFYTPVGLNNNTVFSRLFEAYKFNSNYMNVFLALTKEDNSLVGILDMGYANGGTAITENSSYASGNMFSIAEEETNHLSNIEKEVVDALPAPYDSYNDITGAAACWVTLLKDDANRYDLWSFALRGNRRGVECEDFYVSTTPLPHAKGKSITTLIQRKGRSVCCSTRTSC